MHQKEVAKFGLVVFIFVIVGLTVYLTLGQESAEPATEHQKSQIQDETADWKTYRNEEYGFEFEYPQGIGPVVYDYGPFREGTICFLEGDFYRSEIVEQIRRAGRQPGAKRYFSFCVVNGSAVTKGGNPPPSLKKFATKFGGYPTEVIEYFQEIKTNSGLNALEFGGNLKYQGVLIIELPSGILIEFMIPGTFDSLDIMQQVKDSFRTI